eukprot:4661584-Pyramimonas_sp.AAC.1
MPSGPLARMSKLFERPCVRAGVAIRLSDTMCASRASAALACRAPSSAPIADARTPSSSSA